MPSKEEFEAWQRKKMIDFEKRAGMKLAIARETAETAKEKDDDLEMILQQPRRNDAASKRRCSFGRRSSHAGPQEQGPLSLPPDRKAAATRGSRRGSTNLSDHMGAPRGPPRENRNKIEPSNGSRRPRRKVAAAGRVTLGGKVGEKDEIDKLQAQHTERRLEERRLATEQRRQVEKSREEEERRAHLNAERIRKQKSEQQRKLDTRTRTDRKMREQEEEQMQVDAKEVDKKRKAEERLKKKQMQEFERWQQEERMKESEEQENEWLKMIEDEMKDEDQDIRENDRRQDLINERRDAEVGALFQSRR